MGIILALLAGLAIGIIAGAYLLDVDYRTRQADHEVQERLDRITNNHWPYTQE